MTKGQRNHSAPKCLLFFHSWRHGQVSEYPGWGQGLAHSRSTIKVCSVNEEWMGGGWRGECSSSWESPGWSKRSWEERSVLSIQSKSGAKGLCGNLFLRKQTEMEIVCRNFCWGLPLGSILGAEVDPTWPSVCICYSPPRVNDLTPLGLKFLICRFPRGSCEMGWEDVYPVLGLSSVTSQVPRTGGRGLSLQTFLSMSALGCPPLSKGNGIEVTPLPGFVKDRSTAFFHWLCGPPFIFPVPHWWTLELFPILLLLLFTLLHWPVCKKKKNHLCEHKLLKEEFWGSMIHALKFLYLMLITHQWVLHFTFLSTVCESTYFPML